MASSTTKKTLSLYWRFTRERKPYFWLGTIGAGLGIIVQDIIPPVIIAAAFDKLQAIDQSGASLNHT